MLGFTGIFFSVLIPLGIVLYTERYVPYVTDLAIHNQPLFYALVFALVLLTAWIGWMLGGRWVMLYSAHAHLRVKNENPEADKFKAEYTAGESVVVRSYGRGESEYKYKILTDDSAKVIKKSRVFRTKGDFADALEQDIDGGRTVSQGFIYQR